MQIMPFCEIATVESGLKKLPYVRNVSVHLNSFRVQTIFFSCTLNYCHFFSYSLCRFCKIPHYCTSSVFADGPNGLSTTHRDRCQEKCPIVQKIQLWFFCYSLILRLLYSHFEPFWFHFWSILDHLKDSFCSPFCEFWSILILARMKTFFPKETTVHSRPSNGPCFILRCRMFHKKI